MSDLVERLRSWSLTPHLAHEVREAADRIEALEAALRAIANPDNCLMIADMEALANAALAPEQDK